MEEERREEEEKRKRRKRKEEVQGLSSTIKINDPVTTNGYFRNEWPPKGLLTRERKAEKSLACPESLFLGGSNVT